MKRCALAPLWIVGISAPMAVAVRGTFLDTLVLVACGAAVMAALGLATRTPIGPSADLERHIMRARRCEERAWVLVARVAGGDGLAPRDLVGFFRVTDSVVVRRVGRACEVAGVFDDHRFEPAGLERRLRAAMGEADVRTGWAVFPDDGVTLQVLLDHARAGLPDSDHQLAPTPAPAYVAAAGPSGLEAK